MQQISLTMPENLLKASKEYVQEYGYRNVQEFILELLRQRVILEKLKRYKEIEKEMKSKAKKMTQEEAIRFIKGL